MLFVQEGFLDDLSKDIKSTNDVNGALTVKSADLNKLLSDYDTLVNIFIQNKERITEAFILEFIGDKKMF